MTSPANNREREAAAGAPAVESADERAAGAPSGTATNEGSARDATAAGAEAVEAFERAGDAGQAQPETDGELEAVRAELAEAKEQLLRARAEAENTRRRAEQEISKSRKFAVEAFAAELLSVKDSLDLAASVDLGGRDDDVVRSMHEGLALTLRQLDGAFEKFGIAAVEPAVGDKLNPELHQAMSLQESSEVAPNHVLLVVQKGFTLNDRLLRPAMVIVAKTPAK
ncbi:MAG: nucleotide exchange factor GrpE [Gammaproteobacteria bacterium]|nr:nucleotide exchange factor GrpE [Gammaproteobacteria bacterium]